MKLGIYGGTFNPPHLGHVTSARLALDALGLDRLLFVPAATPPHKALPPDAPAPESRLAMAELAADGLLLPDRVGVSGLELTRPGPLFVCPGGREAGEAIRSGKRIGIDYAQEAVDFPWRFWLEA